MNRMMIHLMLFAIYANTGIAQVPFIPPTGSNCNNVQCGMNEMCNSCGNKCEQQCGKPMMACSTICPQVSFGVCQCKIGFSRNSQGQCVKVCTATGVTRQMGNGCANVRCGANETCNACGRKCELKCGQTILMCPKIACLSGAKGVCQCKTGFYRNPQGKCVSKQACPAASVNSTISCGSVRCKTNEICNTCGNKCEQHCGQPMPMCPDFCRENAPVCQCRGGFYRNNQGQCVNKAGCQNGINCVQRASRSSSSSSSQGSFDGNFEFDQ
ncbi:unnamed protein product, partial [Mesorhabditis belari]|uniref:Trypsin Inhibitor like cysteine rich domain protein n=1 Tax=Mesorhabditis belari TaxID=2138241 RepID=A0AAF3F3C6_9BILA